MARLIRVGACGPLLSGVAPEKSFGATNSWVVADPPFSQERKKKTKRKYGVMTFGPIAMLFGVMGIGEERDSDNG